MKKICLFAIAAFMVCAMASCSDKNKEKKADADEDVTEQQTVQKDDARPDTDDDEAVADGVEVAPDDLWTEEAVADMLRRCYADVSTMFTPQPEGKELNIDLDAVYCTKHWNKVLHQVYELDGRQKRAEDCFFLEDGHWNCWLSGAVSPEHIKVNLLTGNMAEATFQLTHGEEWISMRVALDFEDGAWRIDDWLQIGDTGQSMLQDMEDYLNRNK